MKRSLKINSEMSIKKAVMINAVAKYSVIIMNLLFSAVLARILTPDDYGIVAVLTIFTTFFAKLADMGIGAAIIQFQDMSRTDIEQIFTFTAVIAFGLGIVFSLLGFPISLFYKKTVYQTLCLILSVSVFFNCLNMVPNALLLKDKKFFSIGVRTVVVNVVGYMAALVLALFGGKYYALVLQSVVAAVMNFAWNNHTTQLKICWHFSLSPIKKIWKYSFFQFAFGWINYFEVYMDQILIGGIKGSRQLAYYEHGNKLVGYPIGNIAGIVEPALHPILKDYQNDKRYLYDKYLRIQKMLSLVGSCVTPIFICAGAEIIRIVYGSQWEETIIPFEILCLSIYPKLLMSTTGAMYCSAGTTKMLFVAGTINAMVTCGGVIMGITAGSITTVAIGVAVANWSNMLVTFTILIGKVLQNKVGSYFKELIGDILAMLVVGGVVWSIADIFLWNNIFISLLFKVMIAGILFVIYWCISGKWRLLQEILPYKKK